MSGSGRGADRADRGFLGGGAGAADARVVRRFPMERLLSSLRRPPRWPRDWLGFESLTEGDRAALWAVHRHTRPWLHARRLWARARVSS